MVSIKSDSNQHLYIVQNWRDHKESLLILGIFGIFALCGFLYGYFGRNETVWFLIVWLIIIGIGIISYFISTNKTVFDFAGDSWEIRSKFLLIPTSIYRGKVSNISRIVARQDLNVQNRFLKFMNGNRPVFGAFLEVWPFRPENSDQPKYPITVKRSIDASSHLKNFQQLIAWGTGIVDAFRVLGIPIDFDIIRESEVDQSLDNISEDTDENEILDESEK
jgi:hypothetical protein